MIKWTLFSLSVNGNFFYFCFSKRNFSASLVILHVCMCLSAGEFLLNRCTETCRPVWRICPRRRDSGKVQRIVTALKRKLREAKRQARALTPDPCTSAHFTVSKWVSNTRAFSGKLNNVDIWSRIQIERGAVWVEMKEEYNVEELLFIVRNRWSTVM